MEETNGSSMRTMIRANLDNLRQDAPTYGATESPLGLEENRGGDEKDMPFSARSDAVTDTPRTARGQSSMHGLVMLLCAAGVSEGYDLGVMNGAIVQMQEHFGLHASQVGLLLAATPVGCIGGALSHGALADRFGRRWGLVSAVTFLFSGPFIMAFATSLEVLFAGRMLTGIGIGGGMLVITIYVAELVPGEQRGRLVACQEVALNFGMVSGFFMAWLLLGTPNDWRWMIGFGCILPLPLLISLLAIVIYGADYNAFLPETPRWLAKRGLWQSTHEVLSRYQNPVDAAKKLRELKECEKEAEEFVPWSDILWPWSNRPLRRMLLAGILVATGEMVCGGTSIAYYSNTMMKDELGKSSAYFATVLMGFVRLTGCIFASLAMDHAGRKTLLLTSAAVMMTACLWIGTTTHLDVATWTLPVGLCLLMLGFVIGLGSVSLVYISEIFPTRIRQKGMVVCMFWCRMGGAVCVSAYPILIQLYGLSFTFFVQAFINFVLLALIWLMVPETKGLSLEKAYKLFDDKVS